MDRNFIKNRTTLERAADKPQKIYLNNVKIASTLITDETLFSSTYRRKQSF